MVGTYTYGGKLDIITRLADTTANFVVLNATCGSLKAAAALRHIGYRSIYIVVFNRLSVTLGARSAFTNKVHLKGARFSCVSTNAIFILN